MTWLKQLLRGRVQSIPINNFETISIVHNCKQIRTEMTNSLDENKSTANKVNDDGTSVVLDEAVIASVQAKEKEVFKVFTQTLQFFKTDEFMLSYNGGKDCTVLLHMLTKFYKNSCLKHLRVPVLYIQGNDSFSEVEEFVADIVKKYNVDMHIRKGGIKKALVDMCAEMPKVKAVYMGSRRTDPYCADLSIMQSTDKDWPPLMRISPILDWTCRDVWLYTFVNKVPYCSLYNVGYTSLGSKANTQPNPHLKVFDPKSGVVTYRPAYELTDDKLERAGRFVAKT